MLILMTGLPGTGKTTVALQLAEKLDATILSKDTVRHALFPPQLIEYSTEQDDFIVDLLLRTAEYIWRKHPQQVVILDGRTFSQASQRQHVIDFAEAHQQPWRIIECVCDEKIAKSRLAQPDPAHPAGNRTPRLYDEVKRRWQSIPPPKLTIDTTLPIDPQHIIRDLSL